MGALTDEACWIACADRRPSLALYPCSSHMGYSKYSDLTPFDNSGYYHDCSGCISPDCSMTLANQYQVGSCLAAAPDAPPIYFTLSSIFRTTIKEPICDNWCNACLLAGSWNWLRGTIRFFGDFISFPGIFLGGSIY